MKSGVQGESEKRRGEEVEQRRRETGTRSGERRRQNGNTRRGDAWRVAGDTSTRQTQQGHVLRKVLVLPSASSREWEVLLEDARKEELLAVLCPRQLHIRLSNLKIPLTILP